jgi:GT2 family glycosyltransferase
MVSEFLAVIVATRNRPQNLVRALESIAKSESLPAVVVVVSSGVNVSESINSIQWPFDLIHEHITGYGQIRQKQVGISLIPKLIQWVLFMDDDILLEPKAITNALAILQSSSGSILGIGFGYRANLKLRGNKFPLSDKRFGRVTSDGRNLDYTSSREIISTDWLNGISMWSSSVLQEYSFPYLDSKYSICEDLIFSHAVSRLGKIVYAPTCQFAFQLDEPKLVSSFDAFRASAYWRLYFVLINSHLSKVKFLIVQFYRTLKFLLDKNVSPGNRREVFIIYLDLVRISITKVDAVSMLTTRRV